VLLRSPPPLSPLFPYTTLFRSGLTPVLRLGTARPLPPGWLAGIVGATLGESSAAETTVKVADTATVPVILAAALRAGGDVLEMRSEEHTSELQSRFDLVCRLLL